MRDDQVDSLKDAIEGLKDELKRLKQEKRSDAASSRSVDAVEDEIGEVQEQVDDVVESSGWSRRDFMKLVGGSAAGLGAAAMLPSMASAFKVESDDALQYFNQSGTGKASFQVTPGGNLTANQVGTTTDKVQDIHAQSVTTDETVINQKLGLYDKIVYEDTLNPSRYRTRDPAHFATGAKALDDILSELSNGTDLEGGGTIWLPSILMDVGTTLDLDVSRFVALTIRGRQGHGGEIGQESHANDYGFNSTITDGSPVIKSSTSNSEHNLIGISIFGNGSEGALLKYRGEDNSTIRNFTLLNGGGKGLHAPKADQIIIERGEINDNAGTGLDGNIVHGTVRQLELEDNDIGVRARGGGAIFSELSIERSTRSGFWFDSSDNSVLRNSKINNNGKEGVRISGDTEGAVIELCDFNGNTGEDILHNQNTLAIVRNNRFRDSSVINVHAGSNTSNLVIINNSYPSGGTPIQIDSGATDTYIWEQTLTASDITDNGDRTMFNGRYLNPPVLGLNGSNGNISPNRNPIDPYDIKVDPGSSDGTNPNLQGIGGINEAGTTIILRYTTENDSDNVVVKNDDSSGSDPILLKGGTDTSLSTDGETLVLEYDPRRSKWVQTSITPV